MSPTVPVSGHHQDEGTAFGRRASSQNRTPGRRTALDELKVANPKAVAIDMQRLFKGCVLIDPALRAQASTALLSP
jgi:hypothetical protein